MSTCVALLALLVSFAITAYTVRQTRIEWVDEGTDWGELPCFTMHLKDHASFQALATF